MDVARERVRDAVLTHHHEATAVDKPPELVAVSTIHADSLGNQRMINNYDTYFGAYSKLIDSFGKKMANLRACQSVASFGNDPVGESDVVALKSKLQLDIGRDSVIYVLGVQ